MPATEVHLLGPVELTLDGRRVELGATKQRAVLAMLALRANSVVSTDELIAGLWEEPPATAVKLIQLHVSQLRKLLAGGDAEIVTRGRGYELRMAPAAVDALRLAAQNGDPREELALVRGAPLVDVIDEPFAAAEARRLEELALRVTEDAIEADLQEGRHEEALAALEGLVARNPLRERLHGLRMRALYGAGRQAEALEAFRRARTILVEEIGIEPGPELQRLHQAILQQDPELTVSARPQRPAPRAPMVDRRRLLVIAAAVALAGVAAFGISRLTAPDSLDGVDQNAVGRIDTDERSIVAQYALDAEPGALAAGAGSVWVADPRAGTVSRIEPEQDRIVTIPVASDPVALAYGDDALWVAEREDGTVARISPATNKVVDRVQTGNAPTALAVGFGAVWAASGHDGTIAQVVPGRTTIRRIHLGAPPTAVAVGAGSVWVVSEESGTLFRVDPRTGDVIDSIQVGNRPIAVAAAPTGIWVANRQDATVWRVDAATDSVTDTIRVGREPAAIAAAGDDVWVAGADARLYRLDGRARDRAATIEIGNPVQALAVSGGSLWTAVRSAPARHRGGRLRVGGGPLERALEPGSYDVEAWQVLGLAYDGLVGYRRTGGTTYGPLVGNLAVDVPQPSGDGKVYVFRLRRGIRFSDGKPLTPQDVRVSFEMLLRRHGRFLPGFFDAIIGARQCVRRPERCDLSRGIVADARAHTITIRLARPDPELLPKLAMPLAYVAPAARPFGPASEPPGTGPYRITPGREVVLERNPHFDVWSADARPDGLPDEIRLEVAGGDTAIAATAQGALDLIAIADPFGSDMSPQQLRELAGRYPDRLHTSPEPSLEYMWLNVRTPPFDDVRVRRALNYAVDRAAVAEITGGELLVRSVCQFVPPGYPGYVPACRYTRDAGPAGIWSGPDLERARDLIEESGTGGQRVTVWTHKDKRGVGRYFASLLRDLGYRTRLVANDDYGDYRSYVADSRHRAQIGIEGWVADYPTPASFASGFRCDGYRPASPQNINLPQFCDAGLERAIASAQSAHGSDTGRAWAAVYDRLARAAPAVPLVTRRSAVLVSPRVGNVQHHPLYGVLLDQLWVR